MSFGSDDGREKSIVGFGFKGWVSLFFSIFSFLEVLFFVRVVMGVVDSSFEFSSSFFLRFFVLFVSFVISRWFFNYLNDGDLECFENDRIVVMFVFIIVFIVTLLLMLLF